MNKTCNLKTVDGLSLSAVHTIAGGVGVVLWLHGITVDKDEYLGFFREGAEYLAGEGVDSLRIDFRGHGASDGKSLDFSIVGQMLDVEAALNYLVRHYRKPTLRIHIVGCSFGAPPAIFTAIQHHDLIGSIVLIAPVLSYMRTFLRPETAWAKSIFSRKSLSKAAKTNKLFITPTFPVTMRLVEEMALIKPEIGFRELNNNVAVIHGDADSMVPFSASKDIVTSAPNAKLISFSGMDHGFMDANDESGKSRKSIQNRERIYEIVREQVL